MYIFRYIVIGRSFFKKIFISIYFLSLSFDFINTSFKCKNGKGKKGKILCFISSKNILRKDYASIQMNYIRNSLEEHDIELIEVKLKCSVMRIFLSLVCVLKNSFLIAIKTKKWKFIIQYFYFYSGKNLQLNITNALKETNQNTLLFHDAILVQTFCDAHPIENVVCRFFKEKNIDTLTLQHGSYRKVSRHNPNSLAYRNFVSDLMYMQDEDSMRNFLACGVDKSKCIVNRKIYFNSRVVFNKKISSEKKHIGLVLNGPNAPVGNIKLIIFAVGIAHFYNRKLIIRNHPANGRVFIGLCRWLKCVEHIGMYTNEQYLEVVHFSIINNSGLIRDFNQLSHPYITLDLCLEGLFSKLAKNKIPFFYRTSRLREYLDDFQNYLVL